MPYEEVEAEVKAAEQRCDLGILLACMRKISDRDAIKVCDSCGIVIDCYDVPVVCSTGEVYCSDCGLRSELT